MKKKSVSYEWNSNSKFESCESYETYLVLKTLKTCYFANSCIYTGSAKSLREVSKRDKNEHTYMDDSRLTWNEYGASQVLFKKKFCKF